MIRRFQSYLMFWYSVVFGITFIAFSILLYFLSLNYLTSAIETSLLNQANTEAGAALELDNHTINPLDKYEEPHIHENPLDDSIKELHSLPDRFVHIFTKDGKQLDSYSSEDGPDMPTNKEVLKSLSKGKIHFETILFTGKPFKVIYLPIVQANQITHIIQVGTYITNTISILKKIKITLIILNIIVLTISLVLSYFLSQKAVYPMNIISSTALKISASNLNERLNFKPRFIEVKKLSNILNKMLERIESSFNSQKQFIANASHEMKSPLTALKGTVEVTLRKKRTSEEYIHVLESLLEDVNRISYLQTDLLTLAMIDDKNFYSNFKSFDIGEVTEETIESFQKSYRKSKIQLKLPNQKNIKVKGDSHLFRQVIQNLLDNAMKYSPRKEVIEVSLYLQNGWAGIDFVDKGIGISEKDQPHIFDRFFRVDKSRSRETGGTGLGLAIVKEIVSIHRGEILINSQPGKGSTFTVKLPHLSG